MTTPRDQPSPPTCACGQALGAAEGVYSWFPYRDADPGPEVCTVVVRAEDTPQQRRWVRIGGSDKWEQHGWMVNYRHVLTPPCHWSTIGECWAGTQHTVTAARQHPDGSWTISDSQVEEAPR